jgi:hypothetical protein
LKCELCVSSETQCFIAANAPPGGRCLPCAAKHGRCSFVAKKIPNASTSTPSRATVAEQDPTFEDPVESPSSSKSNILKSIKSKFRSRSDDKPKDTSAQPVPPPLSSTGRGGRKATQIMEVIPPSRLQPIMRRQPSVPTSLPPALPSVAPSPLIFQPSPPPTTSPYSIGGSVPSTSSFQSYATTSFTSLVPNSEQYHSEIDRLRMYYRRSQEALRLEQEFTESQRAFYEQNLVAQEAKHQRELEDVRRQYSSEGKGKKREFR